MSRARKFWLLWGNLGRYIHAGLNSRSNHQHEESVSPNDMAPPPQDIFPITIKANLEGIYNTNKYRICKVGPECRANINIHEGLINIDIFPDP